MKILTTITPAVESLVERWLAPSLDRLGELQDLVIVTDDDARSQGNGGFRSAGFDHHVANKLALVATWAERETAPFLVTDAEPQAHGRERRRVRSGLYRRGRPI